MKNRILLILCLTGLIYLPLAAQKLDMDMLKGMKARNIGPAGMSGRVTSIDVVTDNPEVMYVGTASGGVWKSTSGGIKWDPIFDEEKTASIGAVAIQQSNPSVVWIGTGEGNPRNSLNGGYGVYRTIDGGKNWKYMGLGETRHIHRIIIDPTDPNTIYVGAIGSPWGEHPERGVFKTTDGGKTWNKILFVDNKTGVSDMVIDPTNPNKLVVAMWEHRRQPWTFNSGGPGSGLYVTYDGGENWEKKTAEDGLPKGDLGRIGLAIAPSSPNIIYALIESKKNALYKTTDGGFSWQMINNKRGIGNRPFYYSDIFVDPKNENRLYTVFTYVNVSEDGGRSFKQLMPAYGVDNGVHPDHHAWYIHPENPKFMMDGNDGGLNITRDGGKTWRFVQNLPVAQFYHINVDNEFPYNVYGGMQDNGSWGGPAYVLKAQGIRNSYWQELAFGDGFDVVPDPEDSRYGYAMSQQGFVSRYDRETGYNHIIRPTHPDPDVRLRFNWNSAIAQDPFDDNTIYFGSQFVHKSTNEGDTWTVISPDLTSNDPEKQKQDESGGLTMDATGAENHTTLLVIEPSPVQKGVIWTGSDDGLIYLTRDGGESWNKINKPASMPTGAWIPQIKASATNAGEALLIVNDYRRYNYEPYAYRTRDFGQTWTRIVDGNDVESYTLSIVQDKEEPNLMFLGTDDGLYVTIDGAENWTKWTNGYPTVSTKDLVIHPRENDLVIGTFGRAAYVLDDIRPLRAMAGSKLITDKNLAIFPPPTGILAQAFQQPSGTRFGADGLYNGENRRGGAMISYYFKKPEKKKPEPETGKKKGKKKKVTTPEPETSNDSVKVSYDSLTFTFYNTADELLRTIKMKAPKEEGLNRMYWQMDEKGVARPSRSENKSTREPGGVRVQPGDYKVKVTYGDLADSTTITVKQDPRFDIQQRLSNQKYSALKDLEKLISKSEKAVTRLRESKEIADDYTKRLSDADKEQYKEAIEKSKAISDSLSKMMDQFIGKVDKRQGITLDYNVYVANRIRNAQSYVGNQMGAPGETEQDLIKKAEDAVEAELEKVNNFFQNDWKDYRETMEAIKISPFKDYDPIE